MTRLVIETDHRIKADGVAGDGQILRQEAIAERQQGIDGVTRRSPYDPLPGTILCSSVVTCCIERRYRNYARAAGAEDSVKTTSALQVKTATSPTWDQDIRVVVTHAVHLGADGAPFVGANTGFTHQLEKPW